MKKIAMMDNFQSVSELASLNLTLLSLLVTKGMNQSEMYRSAEQRDNEVNFTLKKARKIFMDNPSELNSSDYINEIDFSAARLEKQKRRAQSHADSYSHRIKSIETNPASGVKYSILHFGGILLGKIRYFFNSDYFSLRDHYRAIVKDRERSLDELNFYRQEALSFFLTDNYSSTFFPVAMNDSIEQTSAAIARVSSPIKYAVAWSAHQPDNKQFTVMGRSLTEEGNYTTPPILLGLQKSAVPAMTSTQLSRYWINWQQQATGLFSTFHIFGQLYDSEFLPQSELVQISVSQNHTQEAPSVLCLSSGDLISAWQSYAQGGSDWNIFLRQFDSNIYPKTSEILVSSQMSGYQVSPVLANVGKGFVVVWTNAIGIYKRLYDQYSNPIDEPMQVNSQSLTSVAFPTVTTLNTGNWVIAYQGLFNQSSNNNIYARVYSQNGAVQVNETKLLNPEFVSDDYVTPMISNSSDGNFLLTWKNFVPGGRIGVCFFNEALSRISDIYGVNDSEFSQSPKVIALNSSRFVVSWSDKIGQAALLNVYNQLFSLLSAPISTPSGKENTTMTIIVLVVIIFLAGFRGYRNQRKRDQNSQTNRSDAMTQLTGRGVLSSSQRNYGASDSGQDPEIKMLSVN